MTIVNLEGTQILLGFTADGSMITARGEVDTGNYVLEKAFIIPDTTAMFEVSDYQGYAKRPASWIEVDLR
jgi:hypothetical protein